MSSGRNSRALCPWEGECALGEHDTPLLVAHRLPRAGCVQAAGTWYLVLLDEPGGGCFISTTVLIVHQRLLFLYPVLQLRCSQKALPGIRPPHPDDVSWDPPPTLGDIALGFPAACTKDSVPVGDLPASGPGFCQLTRPPERPSSCRPPSQCDPGGSPCPTCWRATACCRHWACASHVRSSSAQRPSSFWHCSRTREASGCPEAARLCPEPSTCCTCPWWALISAPSSCHRMGWGLLPLGFP